MPSPLSHAIVGLVKKVVPPDSPGEKPVEHPVMVMPVADRG